MSKEAAKQIEEVFEGLFGNLIPKNKVLVKLLNPSASLPTYGSAGASCADLRSAEQVVIHGRQTKVIKTGIALKIPEGWGGYIRSRSGLASSGIVVFGGVIDSDYRGEVGVILHNSSTQTFFVSEGDRIAQIDFRPVDQITFVQSDELDETERGTDGFGSTGR